MIKEGRKTRSKTTSVCSQGGVSQAFLTLKKKATQKRRLQELMEQEMEVIPARLAFTKQVWKPKRVVSSSSHGR
jgi:hypothetical protein